MALPSINITFFAPYIAVIEGNLNYDSTISLQSGQTNISFGTVKQINSATTNFAIDDRIAYLAVPDARTIMVGEQQYSVIPESAIILKEVIVTPD